MYTLEQELKDSSDTSTELIFLLGSICDEDRLSDCFKNSSIRHVYHAAAYKHVPIIEHNVIPGIENNIFGTHQLAKVSAEFGIEKFVMVSTDKAVRPTNIMGATKRFAELVCQSLFNQYETKFCIVLETS